jgi:hypothetical protein
MRGQGSADGLTGRRGSPTDKGMYVPVPAEEAVVVDTSKTGEIHMLSTLIFNYINEATRTKHRVANFFIFFRLFIYIQLWVELMFNESFS